MLNGQKNSLPLIFSYIIMPLEIFLVPKNRKGNASSRFLTLCQKIKYKLNGLWPEVT